ncbi:MAG TPA: hypothetical protein VGD78_15110, partial [Chthoniobacterales bacterium]
MVGRRWGTRAGHACDDFPHAGDAEADIALADEKQGRDRHRQPVEARQQSTTARYHPKRLAEEEAESLRLSMLEHLPPPPLRLGDVRAQLNRAWRSGALPPG